MDDWSASDTLPAYVKDGTNNHPRSVTSTLTRARPFMDDIGVTSVVLRGSLAVAGRRAVPVRQHPAGVIFNPNGVSR